MNEPVWGFSSELPAMGMLYNTPECATRGELTKMLRAKYDGDSAQQSTWKIPGVTFDQVAAASGKARSRRSNC
jgi:hypothetical protein